MAPYRSGGGAGLFGSHVQGNTRPQVDLASIVDALGSGASQIVHAQLIRKQAEREAQQQRDNLAQQAADRTYQHGQDALRTQQYNEQQRIAGEDRATAASRYATEYADKQKAAAAKAVLDQREQDRQDAIAGVTPAHDETGTSIVQAMSPVPNQQMTPERAPPVPIKFAPPRPATPSGEIQSPIMRAFAPEPAPVSVPMLDERTTTTHVPASIDPSKGTAGYLEGERVKSAQQLLDDKQAASVDAALQLQRGRVELAKLKAVAAGGMTPQQQEKWKADKIFEWMKPHAKMKEVNGAVVLDINPATGRPYMVDGMSAQEAAAQADEIMRSVGASAGAPGSSGVAPSGLTSSLIRGGGQIVPPSVDPGLTQFATGAAADLAKFAPRAGTGIAGAMQPSPVGRDSALAAVGKALVVQTGNNVDAAKDFLASTPEGRALASQGLTVKHLSTTPIQKRPAPTQAPEAPSPPVASSPAAKPSTFTQEEVNAAVSSGASDEAGVAAYIAKQRAAKKAPVKPIAKPAVKKPPASPEAAAQPPATSPAKKTSSTGIRHDVIRDADGQITGFRVVREEDTA